MRLLAEDDGLRRRISERARAYVAAHHSYDSFLDGIERAYLQSIGGGSARWKVVDDGEPCRSSRPDDYGAEYVPGARFRR